MTDPRSIGGGGLTAATGDLTPPDPDEAFDPGERREVEDADHRAEVTRAQSSAARPGTEPPASHQPDDDAPQGRRSADAPTIGRHLGGDHSTDHDERF